MSQQKPKEQLSEAAIRTVYGQGEESVVSLVSELLAHLSHLEGEVKELKDRLGKNSRNIHISMTSGSWQLLVICSKGGDNKETG